MKGDSLEIFIAELFTLVPGLKFPRNKVVNRKKSEELDVVFWNSKSPDGLYFMEHILFIECKNWSKKVGAGEVRDFRSKLKDRNNKSGLFVAANGITGNMEKLTSAHDVIDKAFTDGTQIIVITLNELKTLSSVAELILLIQDKILYLHCHRTSIYNTN